MNSDLLSMELREDLLKLIAQQNVDAEIEGNFRTSSDGQNRAMTKLSMGGMVTTAVTLFSLDNFAYVGCLSGGPRITEQDTLKSTCNRVSADPITFNKRVELFFVSRGSVTSMGAQNCKDSQEGWHKQCRLL